MVHSANSSPHVSGTVRLPTRGAKVDSSTSLLKGKIQSVFKRGKKGESASLSKQGISSTSLTSLGTIAASASTLKAPKANTVQSYELPVKIGSFSVSFPYYVERQSLALSHDGYFDILTPQISRDEVRLKFDHIKSTEDLLAHTAKNIQSITDSFIKRPELPPSPSHPTALSASSRLVKTASTDYDDLADKAPSSAPEKGFKMTITPSPDSKKSSTKTKEKDKGKGKPKGPAPRPITFTMPFDWTVVVSPKRSPDLDAIPLPVCQEAASPSEVKDRAEEALKKMFEPLTVRYNNDVIDTDGDNQTQDTSDRSTNQFANFLSGQDSWSALVVSDGSTNMYVESAAEASARKAEEKFFKRSMLSSMNDFTRRIWKTRDRLHINRSDMKQPLLDTKSLDHWDGWKRDYLADYTVQAQELDSDIDRVFNLDASIHDTWAYCSNKFGDQDPGLFRKNLPLPSSSVPISLSMSSPSHPSSSSSSTSDPVSVSLPSSLSSSTPPVLSNNPKTNSPSPLSPRDQTPREKANDKPKEGEPKPLSSSATPSDISSLFTVVKGPKATTPDHAAEPSPPRPDNDASRPISPKPSLPPSSPPISSPTSPSLSSSSSSVEDPEAKNRRSVTSDDEGKGEAAVLVAPRTPVIGLQRRFSGPIAKPPVSNLIERKNSGLGDVREKLAEVVSALDPNTPLPNLNPSSNSSSSASASSSAQPNTMSVDQSLVGHSKGPVVSLSAEQPSPISAAHIIVAILLLLIIFWLFL